MRKLLLIVSVLLLSFGLASCDLIPEEVIKQGTEEICREDPTNEVCQIESLKDLEDQIVQDLFYDLFSHYNSDELEAYCEEYFSETNVELLDTCRLDNDKLFPSGIDDLEVVSVEYKDDSYQLEVKDVNSNLMYQFRVSIHGGQIAGIVIGAWSFESIGNVYNGFTQEMLEEEIMAFIEDLEDDNMSSEDVCAMWFDNRDNDCDGDVDNMTKKFKAGADLSKKVNIIDTDDDGDGFGDLRAVVSFDFRGHVTVLKIALDVEGDEGEMKLTFTKTALEFIPESEIGMQLEEFVAELQTTIPSENKVCTMWPKDEGIDNDCDLVVSLNDPIKHKFIIKTITPNGDTSSGDPIYEAIFESDFDGHVTVLKIAFTEDDSTGKRKLHIANLQTDVQMEFHPEPKTMMELEKFIADLGNPDLSNNDVCAKWYGDDVDNDCDLRISLNDPIKYVFVIKTINPLYEDDGTTGTNPLYEAVMQSDLDGHVTVLKISFSGDDTSGELKLIIRNVSMSVDGIDNDCDGEDVCDVTMKDEALILYQRYIDVYLDSTVSNDTVAEYFGTVPPEVFYDMRTKDLNDKVQIVIVDMVHIREGMYVVVFDTTRGGETTRDHEPLVIRKRIDKSSPLLSIVDPDDDGDSIPTESKLAVLSKLENDLNDYSIPLEDVCSKYVRDGIGESCCVTCRPIRGSITNDYGSVTVELFESSGVSFINIRQRPLYETSELEDIVYTYMVFFQMDADGTVVVDLYSAEHFGHAVSVSTDRN